MKLELIFGLLFLFFTACSPVSERKVRKERTMSPEVKKELQGVWLDKNTESPVLKIEGDSILYASKNDAEMPYKLVDDTLFVEGLTTAAYPVLERTEYTMTIQTPLGDELSLYKDVHEVIEITESDEPELKPVTHVIKKDSIFTYGKSRYRGYITINPTSIKVVRPGVTEDGFSIDNVYYDNIIHICVYEGKEELCGKDIKRGMFEGIVPPEFLSVSILQDMVFQGKRKDDFVFRATLKVPDGPCYYARVLINEANQLDFKLIE